MLWCSSGGCKELQIQKQELNIAIGLVCWIDKITQLPELQRCLDSLIDFYPVIVVNGKWNDVKGDSPRSIPEAIELIGSYSNVIYIESPNQPEFINRNKYLIQATKMDCDYLIWVDSDEYIESVNYNNLVKEIDNIFTNEPDKYTFLINFYDKRMGGACWQKRGVRHPAFSRHRNRHNELWFVDKQILKYPAKPPPSLVIHQDKYYRSLEREFIMNKRNHDNPIH